MEFMRVFGNLEGWSL